MYVSCIYDFPVNATQSGKVHFTTIRMKLLSLRVYLFV